MKPARSLVLHAVQRHAEACEASLRAAVDAEARGRHDTASLFRNSAARASLIAFELIETLPVSKVSRKKVIHRTEGFAVSDTANLSHR